MFLYFMVNRNWTYKNYLWNIGILIKYKHKEVYNLFS